ncbi:MAG: hypothetical protein GY765_17370 [bacterium]|nr:hypothetical protein [bacterium]
MKKKSIVFGVLFLLLFGVTSHLLPRDKKKPRLYLKVKGVGSLSERGDFSTFMDLKELYILDSDADITVEKEKFFQGFGGEIGIETEKHAVGISASYIARSFQLIYPTVADNREYEFSAVPIFLYFHYKLLDRSFLKAFLTLGEGVYLTTYKDQTAAGIWMECKKNHLAFHAGVTVDLNVTEFLALSLEAGYRVVNFKELTAVDYTRLNADGILGDEVSLYYNTHEESGDVQLGTKMTLPSWESRAAAFSLSGFSLSVGLKLIL